MASHDEVNKALADLVAAADALESVRQSWAKKLGMEHPDELNEAQAEHSAMMPMHVAMMRDNPASASTLKPQMDKMSAKMAHVGEIKAAMAMLDEIARQAADLTARSHAVAGAAKAALG